MNPKRTYTINDSYFSEIDNPQKAYWLGFIAADGCVQITDCGRTKYRLTINVAAQDRGHLECLLRDMNSTHPIKVRKNGSVSFVLSNKALVQDLIRHGIVAAKTLTLEPPKIDLGLIRDYVRGFIDGDGCFSLVHPKTYPSAALHIVGASVPHLEWISKTLRCNADTSEPTPSKVPKKKNTYTIQWGGNIQMLRIFHYLYDNAESFLPRKKIKLIAILNMSPKFHISE